MSSEEAKSFQSKIVNKTSGIYLASATILGVVSYVYYHQYYKRKSYAANRAVDSDGNNSNRLGMIT